jgi:hypothetical protein
VPRPTQIFLSHASSETPFARQLAQKLTRAGLNVWFDETELPTGDNWAKAIGAALDKSNAMVVLLSPNAAKSGWINRDIEYAISTPRFRGRLFPVMVKPTRDDQVPWILRELGIIKAGDPDLASRQVVRALKGTRGGNKR